MRLGQPGWDRARAAPAGHVALTPGTGSRVADGELPDTHRAGSPPLGTVMLCRQGPPAHGPAASASHPGEPLSGGQRQPGWDGYLSTWHLLSPPRARLPLTPSGAGSAARPLVPQPRGTPGTAQSPPCAMSCNGPHRALLSRVGKRNTKNTATKGLWRGSTKLLSQARGAGPAARGPMAAALSQSLVTRCL